MSNFYYSPQYISSGFTMHFCCLPPSSYIVTSTVLFIPHMFYFQMQNCLTTILAFFEFMTIFYLLLCSSIMSVLLFVGKTALRIVLPIMLSQYLIIFICSVSVLILFILFYYFMLLFIAYFFVLTTLYYEIHTNFSQSQLYDFVKHEFSIFMTHFAIIFDYH